jgi:hypothetical protein
VSAGGPAAVEDEGTPGRGPSRAPEQERDRRGDVVGLLQLLHRCEQHVLEHAIFGDVVGAGLGGDLRLDEPCADVPGVSTWREAGSRPESGQSDVASEQFEALVEAG